jgi:hypothetical protein
MFSKASGVWASSREGAVCPRDLFAKADIWSRITTAETSLIRSYSSLSASVQARVLAKPNQHAETFSSTQKTFNRQTEDIQSGNN